MAQCKTCLNKSKRVALDCTVKGCTNYEDFINSEFEDKALTMMQLIANATGTNFMNQELAKDIIVETFKNL